MADNPDYQVGTVSINAGSRALTGVDTFWTTAELEKGDQFGVDGYPLARIDSVNSDGSITLLDSWRGPTLAVGTAYFIRYQADSRFTAQLTSVRKLLSQQNVPALVGLNGAANKLPIFAGPGMMDLVDLSTPGQALIGAGSAVAQQAVLGLPEQLTANRTYYVDASTGADTNNGLSTGTAFKTIMKAVSTIYQKLDTRNYVCYINVADGTYNESIVMRGLPKSSGLNRFPIFLTGNVSSPGNVILSGAATCVQLFGGAKLDIHGFRLNPGTAGYGFYTLDPGTTLNYGNVIFGATTADHVVSQSGSVVTFDANYTIAGGALNHFHATEWGCIKAAGPAVITLTGTPNFTGQFAGVATSELFLVNVTFSGAATGRRFLVHYSGAIRTETNSPVFLPGNSPGIQEASGNFDYPPRVSYAKNFVDQTGFPSGGDGFVDFPGVVYDVGGGAIPSNSAWRPRGGPVIMTARVTFTTGVEDGRLMAISIYKNGVSLQQAVGVTRGTGPQSISITCMDSSNGSDVYQVFARCDSTGGVTINGSPQWTTFSGAQL
ncbi:hypothetical protein ACTJJ7_15680 [Phyllobacterium sp. 22229]|uniref:hypothetical protein n=1 Tax=Phyllobacterium sp. 22229 TaxID=3453895 RepID=UPI003F83BB83